MPISDDIFPEHFTKIDELTLSDHSYLTSEDRCYFLGEYTARQGYAFSVTNQRILNLKKPVTAKNTPQWHYKEQAIIQIAAVLAKALPATTLASSCFVPVPPSRIKSDPLYDDRLLRILTAIRGEFSGFDVRELIVQRKNMLPAHEQAERPRPSEIADNYFVEHQKCNGTPSKIWIFDDVLTTGAHFKAARSVLSRYFPNARISGLFIARRASNAQDVAN